MSEIQVPMGNNPDVTAPADGCLPDAETQRKLLTVDAPDLSRISRAGQAFSVVRSLVIPTDEDVARVAASRVFS